MSANREPMRGPTKGQAGAGTAASQGSGGRKVEDSAAELGLSYARGILQFRGGRAVVMTEEAYVLLLQILYEHAPHILKYAFYDMGYRAGLDIMAGLDDHGGDAEMAFRAFVRQFTHAGYGHIEVVHFDLDAPEVRLRGHNLFEAGLAPKTGIYRTPRSVDHFSRGMFAGFVSELLKREVVCEETACQFRGDPACEFVVLPFQA